ncbi:kinesin [Dendrothele bispora CBS 962.96]|uniref:Kinesin n=1 Tax=Dendrothele bispora (strain CBS 962.96) TaxID=1314807 RepID=A0A4S8M2M4_DENBC|nr:kinesin [Dendrothele bispora CBS 962.96]THU96366.1 kinesin [Dendrothele bispora CBS 962.96]
MAPGPSPSSSTTTSVQVALRIRPPTNQDSTSIPARFQRTVIHASSSTSVAVEATSSAPAAAGATAAASATASGPASKKQHFTFDQVHGPSTTQHALFSETAQPLVSRFLEGFNCTILAYGQTSSGKTFTMTGIDLDANPSDPNNGMGIIPRAVASIFSQARQLKEERSGAWNYSVKGSFIEIYNEDLIDLLSMDDGAGGRREVQIREDKDGHIIWGGLREVNVKNPNEVMTLIRKGTSIRRTNETDMNAQSSRSHAIFSLTLIQKKFTGSGAPPRSSSPLPPGGRSPSRLARPGSVYTGNGSASGPGTRVGSPTFGRPATPSFAAAMGRGGGLRPSSALGHTGERSNGVDEDSGEWVTIVSKFHFVDLAGSERLKRTAAAGERIKEGISINSGLLALGNVISALGDPSRAKSNTATHIPYRDSKLTRLLQDSLGGNAHTLMIACVSPAEWNAAETVNTLKYANRARNIKNRAVVNEKEDGWDDVEWLQGTVTRLRKELKALKSGGSISSTVEVPEVIEGAGKKVLAQMTELQNNYEDLREKFVERTEELTRLRRELGEKHRSGSGAISGTGKYEEIVGPVIEEYEKTISAMEAELSLNRAALRHTNEMVEEKEEEFTVLTERHAATELYVEELRSRVSKLTEREASTEAYVRDLEEKIRAYDETSITSSESMTDLKKEIARFRDSESHSSKYIADLEARLARSDESVLSLQQAIERLEQECDRRRAEVNVLQTRLESFRQDGEAWRTDLEERERRVRELEEKMQEWEKKRQDAGDARVRLGSVAEEVASARRSLEVDLNTPPASPLEANDDNEDSINAVNGHNTSRETPSMNSKSTLEKQFQDLQETHNATLADLTSVTSKYRDALREISDLAAQIQEAKLANPSENASDVTDSDRPPERSVRRRMTSGRIREASEPQYNSGGKRLFFRQAASTESLHSRSLSQSQSLSQELSSVRSRKTSSSSHGTSSSHSPSHSHSTSTLNSLMGSRPNLSISLPPNGSVSPSERSAVSLEKEIMRLQEVLKEREAEISTLESSLKESREAQIRSLSRDDKVTPLPNGDVSPEAYLSPQTRNQFDNIRRSMILVNGNGHTREESDTNGGSDTDDSLVVDRLNELMLSMAQKEASHRETVDSLSSELTTVRRQLDELTTLSRDQTLNMSTEVENLRERHNIDLEKLSAIQERESELMETLTKLEGDHNAAMQELETKHADAVAEKQAEVDSIIARMREEHESALSSLRDELSAATASLEKAVRDHEEAFGKLKVDREEELRKQVQEANDVLTRAREEHDAALQKAIKEYEGSLKLKDTETTSNLHQTEEEYYNALTKLRGDHAEALQKHAAEAAAAIEKLKEEHAAEMRMAEIAKEGSISASESSRATAIKDLQDEHASAIGRKEALHNEALEAVKAEHTRVLSDKEEGHQLELNKLRNAMTRKEMTHNEELEALKAEHLRVLSAKNDDLTSELQGLRSEHEQAVSKLKEEWKAESDQLNSALTALKDDSSAAADKARSELDAAIQSLKEQQVSLLAEIERGHNDELAQLRQSHENAFVAAKAESEEKVASLVRTHTEELAGLKSQHQQEITEFNTTIVAMQEQHTASLEELRLSSGQTVLQAKTQLTSTLNELKEQHAKERETFLKDKELLIQELESHKAAADEFTSVREQSRQTHEESLAQKDTFIQDLEQRLSASETEKGDLATEVARLRAELDKNRSEQTRLIQEASKRESLVEDLERHRSVLAEMQENLQRVKDEKDTLQTEKNRSENLVRELQAQISRSTSPPNVRPAADRNTSFNRVQGLSGAKLPPPTPPPSVPPPPAPRSAHDPGLSVSSQATSSIVSSSSRDSQQPLPESPATSTGHGSAIDLSAKVEQQAKHIDEQDAMIKTLNKQLTHCESDLQTHMDLVSTLETSLGDSEKNLRKARMHATEIARERDRLNGENESLRQELTEVKREVANVRKSIVEEKQSYEQRLDEERKAKERTRQQLDQRMEELTLKRKSKFACL